MSVDNFDTAASEVLVMAGNFITLAQDRLVELGALPADAVGPADSGIIEASLRHIAKALVEASRGNLKMLTELLDLEQKQELRLKVTYPERFVTRN